MTEVRQWLDANDDRIVDLADQLGVPAELVHLAAVFVLGGFTDRQIRDELDCLRQVGRIDAQALGAVVRGLHAIRVVATGSPGGGCDVEDGSVAGHRLMPHTADCIIEAWGPDLASCVTQALIAFVDEFAVVIDSVSPRVLPVAAAPTGPEDELVALLEEVIYTVDVLSMVPVRFHLVDTEDGGLAGDMEVVPLGSVVTTGPAPKGVSYHGLKMQKENEGWRCHVLIDI